MDSLCRTPTPWWSPTISLVRYKAVVFICTRRRLRISWALASPLICSLYVGVCWCGWLSIKLSGWDCFGAYRTLPHIHHISPSREMGAPNEEQILDKRDHESMVMGGDLQSVKFLVLISSSLYWPLSSKLVPKFISSQRRSAHTPKKCFWNMDPLLDSASTLSKIHLNSSDIFPAEE